MTTPTLTDSDFMIFGVPAQFEQDDAWLAKRWKDLQTQTHPDRFASQGQAAQRIATQWSIRINEAYQRLKDPIARATLLCQQAGVEVDSQSNTAMPADFLMQQMQWREALDDANTVEQIKEVQTMVHAQYQLRLSTLAWLLDEKGDFEQAALQIRSMMFIARFKESIATKLNQLEDGAK